jgi:hypothetical protein
MMDQEFRDIIEEQRLLGTEIIIYMDDILIASTSLEGHRNCSTRHTRPIRRTRSIPQTGKMHMGSTTRQLSGANP